MSVVSLRTTGAFHVGAREIIDDPGAGDRATSDATVAEDAVDVEGAGESALRLNVYLASDGAGDRPLLPPRRTTEASGATVRQP